MDGDVPGDAGRARSRGNPCALGGHDDSCGVCPTRSAATTAAERRHVVCINDVARGASAASAKPAIAATTTASRIEPGVACGDHHSGPASRSIAGIAWNRRPARGRRGRIRAFPQSPFTAGSRPGCGAGLAGQRCRLVVERTVLPTGGERSCCVAAVSSGVEGIVHIGIKDLSGPVPGRTGAATAATAGDHHGRSVEEHRRGTSARACVCRRPSSRPSCTSSVDGARRERIHEPSFRRPQGEGVTGSHDQSSCDQCAGTAIERSKALRSAARGSGDLKRQRSDTRRHHEWLLPRRCARHRGLRTWRRGGGHRHRDRGRDDRNRPRRTPHDGPAAQPLGTALAAPARIVDNVLVHISPQSSDLSYDEASPPTAARAVH